MTTPGQQGADAARRHSQMATDSYNLARRHRGPRQGGLLGALGRLIGFLATLVVLAVVVGIFLLILSKAQPDWFDGVLSWLERLF